MIKNSTANHIQNYLRLIRFNKPIGTLLLLYPTLWALWIATNGHPPLLLVTVFSLGVFLTRSAGCAINDYADVEFDKHVLRTKYRPLASGVVSRKSALIVCVLLSLCAFILAISFLHWRTIILSVPALILFITYPFMKRYIAIPQAYLGIAYSFGILMVFMETTANINTPIVWYLFVANLFWVIGYDTMYAMVDIEDDLKIGIKTSAITFGKHVVYYVAICYALFILLIGLVEATIYLHTPLNYTQLLHKIQATSSLHSLHTHSLSWISYLIGLGIAKLLLLRQVWILKTQQKAKYFNMFLSNNWVGLSILLGIIYGYV